MGRKLTTEEFITKAKKLHGDKYDYSEVEYKNNKTKVKIWCYKCQDYFYQRPIGHLQKYGCNKCYNKIPTHNEFIIKADKIHGNYTYPNMYVNDKTKIEIICHIKGHGSFFMSPNVHLSGHGCPKCANENSLKYNTETFIEQAIKIHGELYDYTSVKYININTKINIKCNIHGDFNQMPYAHLKGQGCPKCRKSKGENMISEYLCENDIEYYTQYRFKKCIHKRPLPFDFYLPKYNMCIEYDGKQHFKAIEQWGGENGLKDRQIKDKIKNEYCKNNNIHLLRIKYNENIEEKLFKYFNSFCNIIR